MLVLIPRLKQEYSKQKKSSIGIISDFSNAMYTTGRLEPTLSLEHIVLEADVEPEEAKQGSFRVVLSQTVEEVNTQGLLVDINNMRGQMANQDLINIDRIYNTMLKNLENNLFTPIGRSALIRFEGQSTPLGGGIMNFQGYNAIQAITNGWKPYLNVDIANCATIMNANVLEVMANFLTTFRDRWSPQDCGDMKNLARGLIERINSELLQRTKVQYKPTPSKTLGGTVQRLSDRSVSQEDFDFNGARITVFDYFRTQYRCNLQYKNGPCLILNGDKQVPAEICVLKKGQSYNRKLNADQTTAMLECARKDPHELESAIMNVVKDLNLHQNPVLKDFGVTFAKEIDMLKLQARVLAPPLLCYGKDRSGNNRGRITPDSGTWDIWRMNFEFLKPISVKTWGLMLCGCQAYDDAASQFIDRIRQKGRHAGVVFESEPIRQDCSSLRDNKNDAKRNIKTLCDNFDYLKKQGCEVVLVVVPKKGSDIYGQVKQAAEIEVGLLTQCVALQNFAPKNPSRVESIVGNIVLKINSKLGGVNHTVIAPEKFTKSFKVFSEPVIIIGADVTHPPAGIVGYSYAAVTASIDRSGMPYMMHVQAQEKAGKGAAEVIVNFADTMRRMLLRFREVAKCIPTKIIYFRDGVGEGQFPEILHVEMRQIRAACASLKSDYEPKITFITVQKRHKTRFFLHDSGRAENAPPGTVVDVHIVHPTETDFFLLSHKGLLGTSRPTRYHLLWDDSDFSADEIQTLTYYLCYMYVRCNRSVKIPAPTYYSHWAAARAKVLTEGYEGNLTEINERLRRHPGFEKAFPMHFV
jgi:eukaryotic translation initiation factor 2C